MYIDRCQKKFFFLGFIRKYFTSGGFWTWGTTLNRFYCTIRGASGLFWASGGSKNAIFRVGGGGPGYGGPRWPSRTPRVSKPIPWFRIGFIGPNYKFLASDSQNSLPSSKSGIPVGTPFGPYLGGKKGSNRIFGIEKAILRVGRRPNARCNEETT